MTDIYTHNYMKNPQFDSLVWGSLMLAPNILTGRVHTPPVQSQSKISLYVATNMVMYMNVLL